MDKDKNNAIMYLLYVTVLSFKFAYVNKETSDVAY